MLFVRYRAAKFTARETITETNQTFPLCVAKQYEDLQQCVETQEGRSEHLSEHFQGEMGPPPKCGVWPRSLFPLP
mgnify:CR=1 FL=1